MPDVWEIMRAIRSSDLPSTDRHILMTLASLADPTTGVIPDRFMPSYTDLSRQTGMGRSTVARRMPLIEAAGWVVKTAPSKRAAWKGKETNSYTLFVPVSTSPTAGPVPQRDQSPNGTSPTARLGLVPQRDSTSPTAGHEVNPCTKRTKNTSSSGTVPKQPKPEPQRDDVERVCQYLVEWRVKNKCKKPTISETWRREARLMIDTDGRDLELIREVTAWSQRHHFWRANIKSIPKLREQFDTLRLQMESRSRTDVNQQGRRSGGMNGHVPYQNPKDDSVYLEWTNNR